VWSGVDVAKDFIDTALWPKDHPIELSAMRRLPVKRFDRTPEGVAAFFAWAEARLGATPRVVMEATGGYSIELAAWMLAERPDCLPAIVNPRTAKHYMKSIEPRDSTDQTAARALARYGVEREPSPYEPPSRIRAELRHVTRYRQTVVEMRGAEQQRLDMAVGAPADLRRMMAERVRQMRRQEKKLEARIKTLVRRDPSLLADVELLRTIRGVDWITAATVLAEVGDLRRFVRARQLTAFVGVNPVRRQSGSSVRGRTRLSRMGPARVRRVLHLAARSAVTGENQWSRQYRALQDSGKTKMAALGAIMRKLLCVMRAMLISGQPWRPDRDEACG
jgi:transposase